MAIEISSTEFEQNFSRYEKIALKEPVFILKDGKPYTVMISFAYYETLIKGQPNFKTADPNLE